MMSRMKYWAILILVAFVGMAVFGLFMMNHSDDCMTLNCPIVSLFSRTPVIPVFAALILSLLILVSSFLSLPVLAVATYHQSPDLKLSSARKKFHWLSLLENSPSFS